ncbi:hypothetical protein REPUB_Repub11eG0091200 [Reevesia pubescens]
MTRAKVIFLQETNFSKDFADFLGKSFSVNCDFSWEESAAESGAGGILTVWVNNFLIKVGAFSSRFIVPGSRILVEFRKEVLLINVYGPCDATDKRVIWSTLGEFVIEMQLPCLLAGDFNTIRGMDERKYYVVESRGIDDFNDFILSNDLVDTPMVAKQFTWFSRGKRRSRLDRVLISGSLFMAFPSLVVRVLSFNFSDHIPLFLFWFGTNWGPKPFR